MNRIYNRKTAKQVKIAGSATIPYVDFLGKKLYVLSTAVASNGSTDDPVGAAAGDFAFTTHATGRGLLFVSNGTKLVTVGDGTFTQAAVVAALGTTSDLTAVPGSFADEAAVQTYLVTLRADTEARLDAIEAKVDAILTSLKTATLMASA